MDSTNWKELIRQLQGRSYLFGLINASATAYRVEFDAGLTDAEVFETEKKFGFRFPTDLRDFLQTALPRGPQFPNWRAGDERVLREWLDLPRQGILFDIEHNGFWLPEWGPRPDSLIEAFAVASEIIGAAPRLIPVYAHRMMPDEPHLDGNPVFSVHQTDIIYYGFDLADYFRHEFQLAGRQLWPEHIRPIRFWDLDRFQDERWADGPGAFDNSKGKLP